MGPVLWAVVQDKPMVYEQEDVANALAMRHDFMKKTFIHLNLQIEIDKPEIWQLVSSITIWYIWKARCLRVFQTVTKRPGQINSRIWIEILRDLISSLDNIKDNAQ